MKNPPPSRTPAPPSFLSDVSVSQVHAPLELNAERAAQATHPQACLHLSAHDSLAVFGMPTLLAMFASWLDALPPSTGSLPSVASDGRVVVSPAFLSASSSDAASMSNNSALVMVRAIEFASCSAAAAAVGSAASPSSAPLVPLPANERWEALSRRCAVVLHKAVLTKLAALEEDAPRWSEVADQDDVGTFELREQQQLLKYAAAVLREPIVD
jgi:hypothetical protein